MNLRFLPFVFTVIASITFAQTPTDDSSSALTVQGRVVQDPGGQPIRKVDIQLTPRNRQANENYTTSTDAEGKFQIDEVKPGTYRVTLDHSGFIQSRSRIATILTLTSPADGQGLVFRMRVAATIYGKILDSDGDPMPNVSVQAIPALHGGVIAARSQGYGKTNDLGEYRIANLRPGKYLVSADSYGQKRIKPPTTPKETPQTHLEYVRTYYPDALDKEHATPVEVHSGDELPLNITPLASPTFFIRGTVSKPAGTSFVQVMLRSGDGVQQNVEIGEGGDFNIQDLLPGT